MKFEIAYASPVRYVTRPQPGHPLIRNKYATCKHPPSSLLKNQLYYAIRNTRLVSHRHIFPITAARMSTETKAFEELAKVREELRNVKQVHLTSELALQNAIEMHKAEIKRLQTEAETSLRQNTHLQTEIKRLESGKGDEERTSSLQEIQQLQHFLFSKLLSIQNDQNISLPTASGHRLLFKRQHFSIPQDTLAQWI